MNNYLIIGDGISGATAAETIREQDKESEIHIFTEESEPLYNRIMLKSYMKGELPDLKFTRVHDVDWYEKRDIEIHLDTRVEKVNEDEKEVETDEGLSYMYDKLLVATGGSPRRLPQDEGFDNLYYMWTMGDAKEIEKSASDIDKAVVIGGGLLGIDLAMAYAENDCETYYLVRGDNWWHRGLDSVGGEIIQNRLEQKGCHVVTNTEVSELVAEDGEIKKVIAKDGEEFECEAVGVAIGQTPNSNTVDVEKNGSGMIKTNKYMQTSDQDIYSAGNMVEYESPVFERKTVNGSWDHSEAMGEIAAMNMIGEKTEFEYVNTYGVGHFDVQFLAMGDWTGEPLSKNYDEDGHYRRIFFDGNRVVGAVMIGYTKGQEQIKQMIKQKEKVEDKNELLEKDHWK